MYVPKHFEGDEATGRQIMQAHGWALLMTADADAAPVATHLALVWQDDGSPHGSLIGHMARANGTGSCSRAAPTHSRCSGARTPMSRRPGTRRASRCRPGTTSRCMPTAGRRSIEDTKGALDVLARLAAVYEGSRRGGLEPRPPAAGQCRGADQGHRRLPHPAHAGRDQAQAQPEPRAGRPPARHRQARGERQPGRAGDGQLDEARAALWLFRSVGPSPSIRYRRLEIAGSRLAPGVGRHATQPTNVDLDRIRRDGLRLPKTWLASASGDGVAVRGAGLRRTSASRGWQ